MPEPETLDVEEAVAHLEAYRRQIELVSRNLELIQGARGETARARQALEGWRDQKKGTAVMVPLGANTFVVANVVDPQNVLLGAGHGYSAERPTSEAVRILEKREKELAEEADRTGQGLYRLRQEAAQLQELMNEALESSNGGPPGGATT